MRGEYIYNDCKRYVHDNSIPIHKLVAITTDGHRQCVGCIRAVVIPISEFLNYHCVINQQALASKAVDLSHVMTLVIMIVNLIRAKGLQHRLCKSLLHELDATYGDLILHACVRWLSG